MNGQNVSSFVSLDRLPKNNSEARKTLHNLLPNFSSVSSFFHFVSSYAKNTSIQYCEQKGSRKIQVRDTEI